MFNFNVKIFGNMSVTVVANNEKDAERILKDTIKSINKDIKNKISKKNKVNIKNSNIKTNIDKKLKDRIDER